MLKSNSVVLCVYRGLDMSSEGNVFEQPSAVTPSFESELLKEIFHEDEDGIMQCDLSVFLSDDVRPEIRNFVQSNLLKMQNPLVMFDDEKLTDDERIVLSPSPSDTLASYTQRLEEYFKHENNKDS